MHFDVSSHVLYEDQYLVAIDKPHGLQVEPDKYGHPNLQQAVLDYLHNNEKKNVIAGIVHRIDRPVAGVVVMAKTQTTLVKLNRQVELKQWKKLYRTVVEGVPDPPKQRLQHYLQKDTLNKKAIISATEQPLTKLCSLSYSVINSKNNYALLEVNLHTGRYHQIRAQLSFIHHPIVGDSLYGSVIQGSPHIELLCYQISFPHPVTGAALQIRSKRSLHF